MKFVKPVPFGNISNHSTSNMMSFSTYPNDKVISPYDGVVVATDNSKCDGFIMIEHFINGETFYSEICKVKTPYVFDGYKVRKNDLIGSVGNDGVIEYRISDKNGNFVKMNKFFIEMDKPLDDVTNTKNEIDKNTDKKKKSKLNIDLGLSTDKDLPVLYRGGMNLFALPFSVVGSAFKGINKKIKNDDEKLNENIDKIKKLIKY